MLNLITPEDFSVFWDRLTAWVFHQRTETLLMMLIIAWLAFVNYRQQKEIDNLRDRLIYVMDNATKREVEHGLERDKILREQVERVFQMVKGGEKFRDTVIIRSMNIPLPDKVEKTNRKIQSHE